MEGASLQKNDITLGSGFPQSVGNFPTKHQGITLLEVSRAILTPKNENFDKISEVITDKFPGIGHTYLSADSVAEDDLQNAYPTEFLNSITLSGMPPHAMTLKVGAPIILLRNLTVGLGNGL